MLKYKFAINFVFVIFGTSPASGIRCDTSTNAQFKEGNLGESHLFSWLGILRVHLHDGVSTKIALTGVVLIKENYVIANADDLSRIPMHIFTQESRVMFIPTAKQPWYCKAASYSTHPEYEYATYNTIALIELALDDVESYPVRPICWPRRPLNTAGHLYVTGYTDDNKLLEKLIYKLQFVDQPTCEEFYDKAGLSASSRMPVHYQCGFAQVEQENCVWDNGMALISNVTGWFTLIGLGVRGPGCAAPARFIDIYEYVQWLEQQTTFNEVYDYQDFRRRGEDEEYVPAHELFRSSQKKQMKGQQTFNKYPFSVDKMTYFNLEQIDDNAYSITAFDNIYEPMKGGCSNPKVLIYREHFKISTKPGIIGHASYKLTFYDLTVIRCTCVKVMVDTYNRSEATFYFREVIDFDDGGSLETPDDVLRYYDIPHRPPKDQTKSDPWEENPNFKPKFLKDDLKEMPIPNAVLLLQFQFYGEAVVRFESHGIPWPQTTTTTTKPPKTTTQTTKPKLLLRGGRRKHRKWGASDERMNNNFGNAKWLSLKQNSGVPEINNTVSVISRSVNLFVCNSVFVLCIIFSSQLKFWTEHLNAS